MLAETPGAAAGIIVHGVGLTSLWDPRTTLGFCVSIRNRGDPDSFCLQPSRSFRVKGLCSTALDLPARCTEEAPGFRGTRDSLVKHGH